MSLPASVPFPSTPVHAGCTAAEQPRQVAYAVALPAVAALAARALTGPRPIDDAYITFRYARSMAEGMGLVYNPGEWVLGTTAPLWALFLAGLARLTGTAIPVLAASSSALFDAVNAALLAWLCLRLGLGPLTAALAGLTWAVNPFSAGFAASGMESSAFVLVMLGSLCLAAARRDALAAFAGGLGVGIRPEAALLVVAAVTWCAWREHRVPWRAGLAGALPIACWAAALVVLYGSPIPQTVLAKQVAYPPRPAFENLAAFALQAGLPGWSTFMLNALPPGVAWVVAVLGAVTLLLGLRRALPLVPASGFAWQPFALFWALYVGAYVVAGLRGGRLWPWYLVPLVPAWVLVAQAAAHTASRGGGRWLLALPLLWQLPAINWTAPFLANGADLSRERMYLALGDELRRALPEDAVIAAPEIGALGYASRLRILDTVGLVSPAVLRFYPPTGQLAGADNMIPPAAIAALRPDVVVSLDQFAGLLRSDPWFAGTYQVEQAIPVSIWASTRMLVFRRVRGAEAGP